MFVPINVWWFTRRQIGEIKAAGLAWLWGDLFNEVTDGNGLLVEDSASDGIAGYACRYYGCTPDGTASRAAMQVWQALLSTRVLLWCGQPRTTTLLVVATSEQIEGLTAQLERDLGKVPPNASTTEIGKTTRRARLAVPANVQIREPEDAWASVCAIIRTNPHVQQQIARMAPSTLAKARHYWAGYGLATPWKMLDTHPTGNAIYPASKEDSRQSSPG